MQIIQDSLEYITSGLDQNSPIISFKEIDNLIKNFNIRYRLEYILSQTPEESRICADNYVNELNYDIYTLVEYYSISNAERLKYLF